MAISLNLSIDNPSLHPIQSPNHPLSTLHHELWMAIFSKLSAKDLKSCLLTCKRWSVIISTNKEIFKVCVKKNLYIPISSFERKPSKEAYGRKIVYETQKKQWASSIRFPTTPSADVFTITEYEVPEEITCFFTYGDHFFAGVKEKKPHLTYSIIQTNNEVLHFWNGLTAKVNCLHSDRADFLVSGSDDKAVIIWDFSSSSSFRLNGHKQGVLSVLVEKDSIFSTDSIEIFKWGIQEKACIFSISTSETITTLDFFGPWLISGHDTKTLNKDSPHEEINHSHSMEEEKNLCWWDKHTGCLIKSISHPEIETINCFLPHEQGFLTASLDLVYSWTSEGTCPEMYDDHDYDIKLMANWEGFGVSFEVDPDAEQFVNVDEDEETYTINFLDLKKFSILASFSLPNRIIGFGTIPSKEGKMSQLVVAYPHAIEIWTPSENMLKRRKSPA